MCISTVATDVDGHGADVWKLRSNAKNSLAAQSDGKPQLSAADTIRRCSHARCFPVTHSDATTLHLSTTELPLKQRLEDLMLGLIPSVRANLSLVWCSNIRHDFSASRQALPEKWTGRKVFRILSALGKDTPPAGAQMHRRSVLQSLPICQMPTQGANLHSLVVAVMKKPNCCRRPYFMWCPMKTWLEEGRSYHVFASSDPKP